MTWHLFSSPGLLSVIQAANAVRVTPLHQLRAPRLASLSPEHPSHETYLPSAVWLGLGLPNSSYKSGSLMLFFNEAVPSRFSWKHLWACFSTTCNVYLQADEANSSSKLCLKLLSATVATKQSTVRGECLQLVLFKVTLPASLCFPGMASHLFSLPSDHLWDELCCECAWIYIAQGMHQRV